MLNINGYRNQVKPDSLQTSKGIAEELILNLKEVGGLGTSTTYNAEQYPTTKGNLTYSYPIDSEKTKHVMLKLLHASGANILFHTFFCAPIMEGDNVVGVIVENKSGRQAIYAKVVIDASGDGDVASRAGAPWWQAKAEDKHLKNCLMYKVAMNPASTPQMKGVIYNNDLLYWGPTLDFDATDAEALSRGEVEARLAVYDHFARNQRNSAPLLDDAYIVETAPLMGIRQTRFIKGLYTTSNDDALTGRRFDDAVAMSACPIIEYYGYRRYLEHTGYEIPYRCLLPQKVEGLILAGRCISSDQQSYESWRAMAPVMCIGEAAGTAAAVSVRTNRSPKEVDVEQVRDQLIAQGAEIGQNKKD